MPPVLENEELMRALMKMLATQGQLSSPTDIGEDWDDADPKGFTFLGQKVEELLPTMPPPRISPRVSPLQPVDRISDLPELAKMGVFPIESPIPGETGFSGKITMRNTEKATEDATLTAITKLLSKTGGAEGSPLRPPQPHAEPILQAPSTIGQWGPASSSFVPSDITSNVSRETPPAAGSGKFMGLGPLEWMQLIGKIGEPLRVGTPRMIRHGGGFRPFQALGVGAELAQKGNLAEQIGGTAGQAVRAGLPQLAPGLLQLQQVEAEKKIRGEEFGRTQRAIQQPGIQVSGVSVPKPPGGVALPKLALNELIAADADIQAVTQEVETLGRIAKRTRSDKDIDNWRLAESERRKLVGGKRTEYVQMTKDERELAFRDTAMKLASKQNPNLPQFVEFEFDEKGAKIRLKPAETIEQLETGAISKQGGTPADILRRVQAQKFTDSQLLSAQNEAMRRVDDIRQRIQGVGPMGQFLGPLQGDELLAMRIREIGASEQAQQLADEHAKRRGVGPTILYPDLQVPDDILIGIKKTLSESLRRKPTMREFQKAVAKYLIGDTFGAPEKK